MGDLYKMEEEAIELYQRGEFTLARECFEQISRTTNSSSKHNDLIRFNIASCYASDKDHTKALNQIIEIKEIDSHDFGSMYNKALCLNRLGRADLALSILDMMAQDKTSDEKLIIHLFLNCMNNLSQNNLNRSQCEILERLLIRYKPQIIDNYGVKVWTQNMGHVLFLQDTRFEACLELYEALLGMDDDNDQNSLLQVDRNVLSNLCVSYILTGRNRDAEELIKEVEHEDEPVDDQSSIIEKTSDKRISRGTVSHLTHLNLAIGTLYCVKGNHEFGLTRIFKSLEPIDEKLTTYSWQQARKCILSTLDKHCKQLIYIKDDLFDLMIAFLIQCEAHGIYVVTSDDSSESALNDGKNSVTYEARYLRSIILSIYHD